MQDKNYQLIAEAATENATYSHYYDSETKETVYTCTEFHGEMSYTTTEYIITDNGDGNGIIEVMQKSSK